MVPQDLSRVREPTTRLNALGEASDILIPFLSALFSFQEVAESVDADSVFNNHKSVRYNALARKDKARLVVAVLGSHECKGSPHRIAVCASSTTRVHSRPLARPPQIIPILGFHDFPVAERTT
jgi:hypothetical protein